jgi:hypothetical protein
VDAVVGVGLIWYLGEVGFVAALPTRVGAAVLLVLWAATRVFAVLNRPGVSGGFGLCLYPVGTRRFRAG